MLWYCARQVCAGLFLGPAVWGTDVWWEWSSGQVSVGRQGAFERAGSVVSFRDGGGLWMAAAEVERGGILWLVMKQRNELQPQRD